MQKQKTRHLIKNEGSDSTHVLKSKYLDQHKNTSGSSNYAKNDNAKTKRILLTDLCPEQKAKIGELIKTLEQRRIQNQDLQEQIQSWKSNYLTLQKVKSELQNIINIKNQQIQKMTKQIEKVERQKLQKEIQTQQLHIALQKAIKKADQKINVSIGTDEINKLDQYTQTKQKKVKQKSREVQVNLFDEGVVSFKSTKKNHFYQPNSRSFDKIMNDKLAANGHRQTQHQYDQQQQISEQRFLQRSKYQQGQNSQRSNSYDKLAIIQKDGYSVKNVLSSKRNQANSNQNQKKILKAEQLQADQNDQDWSEYKPDYIDSKNNPQQNSYRPKKHQEQQTSKFNTNEIQIFDTENDDDQFEMLAKKWLQLKQKNIQQMTQGFYQNPQNQPVQDQDLAYSKNLQIQSKLKAKNKLKLTENNDNDDNDEIDENELNRALKSKQFSASRLLNSKSKRNISQNSDRKSLENSNASYKPKNNNDNKNVNKNSLVVNRTQGPPKPKGYNHQIVNSKTADFYSSDLLDLVEQINK